MEHRVKDLDWNVLHIAAFKGDDQAVTQLLALDPTLIDKVTRTGMTALHIALEEGHQNVVTTLLETCPSLIGASTYGGMTALHFAAHKGHDTLVARVLAAKPELINAITWEHWTALHLAAESGHELAAARLLEANPNLVDAALKDGRTALHLAAENGHDKVVIKLLAVNPTVVNAFGVGSALHEAAKHGHENVVAQILKSCPSSIADASGGWTALHYAACGGFAQVVALLLAASPSSSNAMTYKGQTPLHHAARGHSEVVKQLLDVNLDLLNVKDVNSWTAFQLAIHYCDVPTIKAFLARKPELIRDTGLNGNTVLHSVIEHSHQEVIEEMWKLNPGAVRVVNTAGDTPFHLAIRLEENTAIDLLQWSLTFDEVVGAYATCNKSCDRLRPVLETQGEALNASLLPDVIDTVFEYLGFDSVKRPPPKKLKLDKSVTTR